MYVNAVQTTVIERRKLATEEGGSHVRHLNSLSSSSSNTKPTYFLCSTQCIIANKFQISLEANSSLMDHFPCVYFQENGSIVHLVTGLCLDQNGHPESPLLTVQECAGSASQQWTWDNVASQSR